MELKDLLLIVPPAIVLSVLAYFVKFFGKIIEDQNPFSDDRNWSVEISGVFFMLNLIISGLIGVFVATNCRWGVDNWWIHLITLLIISSLGGALYMNNTYLASELFSIGKKNIDKLEKKSLGVTKFFSDVGNYIGVGILPIILFFFGTLEYLSKNIYFIIFYFCNIFFIFILLALNFSLKKILRQGITPVNVYFTDNQRDPLINVNILKMNPDNIRIREGDRVIFLNKNEVLKTEMVLPPDML